jgi:glycosyltransferase involved in cell wall biosynthesis
MSKQTTCFWGSSYDRGLQHLLKIWPQVKEEVPEAELHICYGWDLFDKAYHDNAERQAWKEKINDMMKAPGITHHGRVGKDELKEIRQKCGIWAYSTHFDEIHCITALECQLDGCVPCVIEKAALSETVQSGVKVQGDIYDPKVREKYKEELIALMKDTTRWHGEQIKGIEFAKSCDWSEVAKVWSKEFE